MNKKQQKLLNESLVILQALDFPNAQQNERSALILLALLNLMPPKTWKEADAPMIGIRAILDFCRSIYGKPYAENTRESFRRQNMHQFVAAGLVVENPDNPKRPINSPKWCYQIEPDALRLLRDHFKAKTWKSELAILFAASTAGAVYVTAFHTRVDMTRYLTDISWETEVWIAEAPTHLIHFNGERFLGPYA